MKKFLKDAAGAAGFGLGLGVLIALLLAFFKVYGILAAEMM